MSFDMISGSSMNQKLPLIPEVRFFEISSRRKLMRLVDDVTAASSGLAGHRKDLGGGQGAAEATR